MWIRVEANLSTHRKTRRLARALGVPAVQVVGHLVCLWAYALAHAADGDLRDHDPEDIADGALWAGDAWHFVDALTTVGLLDQGPRGLVIHDWQEYAAGLREAERKRAYRAKRAGTCPGTVPGQRRDTTADVLGQSWDSPGTATDARRDVPSDGRTDETDETRRDETDPDESSALLELALEPAEPATVDPPEVVLTYPAVGRGASTWHLTEPLLGELQDAYPDLDVRAECRRALAWVQASPRRRKTPRGYQAFLTAWLQRSQERPGATIVARAGPRHPPRTQANLEAMQRWLERHEGDH